MTTGGLFSRCILMIGAVCCLTGRVLAVNGISVTIRNGSGTLKYYGTVNGELWRHDISGNQVQGHRKLFDGPCSRPCINPGGTKVAFVKRTSGSDAKICVIPIDGGAPTEIAHCHENSQIDFPHNDWIYFTMGCHFDHDSRILKRVSPNGGSVEDVRTFPFRVSTIQLSNDLTRATIRTGDKDGTVTGKILCYDMAGGTYENRAGGSFSCAGGMFSDGRHFMDGNGDHDGFDIRDFATGNKAKSFMNSTAVQWPPCNGNHGVSSTHHGIFNSGAATNAPKWMCINLGGSRNDIKEGVFLINWVDEECINVCADLDGVFDNGDFWEGEPDEPDPPVLKSLRITPRQASVAPGGTVQFSAEALDQYGTPFSPQPSLSWWTSGGGEMNSSSTYTAGSTEGGPYLVVATGSAGDITVRDTAEVTIQSEPPLNTGYMTRFLTLQNNSSMLIPENGHSMSDDLLGGEATTAPAKGDKVSIDGSSWTWTMSEDDDGMWVDTKSDDGFFAYFTLSVVADSDREVRIACRHDDDLRAWVYGTLVLDESGWDGGDENLSDPVQLRAGANRFLFKLHENSGGNHFAARIVDKEGNDATGLSTDFTPGGLPSEGVVTILSPTGGESFGVGGELTVSWEIDPQRLTKGVLVELSVDNGAKWHTISGDEAIHTVPKYYDGNTGTFIWTIVDPMPVTGGTISPISSECYVKVSGPYETDTPTDIAGPFTIASTAVGSRGIMRNMDHSFLCKKQGTALYVNVQTNGPFRLSVLDIRGRLISSVAGEDPGSVVIPETRLSEGMYVVELRGSGATLRRMVSIGPENL